MIVTFEQKEALRALAEAYGNLSTVWESSWEGPDAFGGDLDDLGVLPSLQLDDAEAELLTIVEKVQIRRKPCMMKNDYGITVTYWGDVQVTGRDENNSTFSLTPDTDESGNAFIRVHGEKHYAEQFRTVPLKLPIYKYMEVSTEHIQEKTNTFLRDASKSLYSGISVYPKGVYGYWVNVDPGRSDIPEDLAALIELANEKDCMWLVLDSDGAIVEGLPKWEW
ncbi:hypothetical protein MKZ21_30740 [Paenibacillus sp. FSL P2-0536]|uniref:DUF5983 family protein n=1 Tax=Paenibacillus sp. FSL P2-0536 TaxID=2921629 RepID=UPI0030F9D2C2